MESDHERDKVLAFSEPANRIVVDNLNNALEINFEFGATVTEISFQSAQGLIKSDIVVYTAVLESEPYRLLTDAEWTFISEPDGSITISLITVNNLTGLKLKFPETTSPGTLDESAASLQVYNPALVNTRFQLIRADYARSSIAVDLQTEGAAGTIKKIELIPGKGYQDHRIDDNSLDVYISLDNSLYDLVDKTLYECEKNADGTVIIVFENAITAKQVVLQFLFDERTDEFITVNRAKFLNDHSKTLKV